MKSSGHGRSTLTIYIFFVLCGISGFIGLFALAFRPVDRRVFYGIDNEIGVTASGARSNAPNAYLSKPLGSIHEGSKSCATVEEMGEVSVGDFRNESLRVLHFNYEHFKGNISNYTIGSQVIDFRVRDWGPAPRWVAFVDFFLASRAKHAFISGAHRRVGTTYAQLIAALAAARNLGMDGSLKGNQFSFFSSFQGNLLFNGLRDQVGWGHVWNRFAGPLSCPRQPDQCALTPLLTPAWWDGVWQSPLGHDIRRLETYGIRLSGFGTFDERRLQSYCNSKKHVVMTMPIAQM